MHTISILRRSLWFHALLLTLVVAVVFARTVIHPMDDHFLYQKFIEALAAGRLDLSIPGFHGASFLALPLHLSTGSAISNIQFQILCALLLIPSGALAANALLRDRFQALLFTYAVACMPFLFFFAFRGFTFPSFTLMLLLTLWLRGIGSKWAWLPWSLSMLIKPFTAALLPLFILWRPQGEAKSRGWTLCVAAAVLPVLYFGIEYLQIGRIIIGAHEALDQSNVFQWWRLPLNMAHGVQMLFSVHNFYYPDPAKTSLGNMLHGSPVLMVLGFISYLYPREFWKDKHLGIALGLSAIIAFLLTALLDHMDQFYLETCMLLLTIGAMPVLAKYRLLIPIVLATFHFQFFYLYLHYRGAFFADTSLFWIIGFIDLLALLWIPELIRECKRAWRPSSGKTA